MQPGSIVIYTPRDGDESYVALVQSVWPDDSLQLFVLHHQASANVRSALASQCHLVMGPDLVADLAFRVNRLEDLVNFMIERQNAGPLKGATPKPAPEPEPEPEPDEPEEEEENGEPEESDAEPVTIATTSKPPWPSSRSRSTSRARQTPSTE